MKSRAEMYFEMGLLLLPIMVAWLFAPSLADAFDIKNYLATLAILILVLAYVSRHKHVMLSVPTGIIGIAFAVWLLAVFVSAILAENTYLALGELLEIIPFVILVWCLFSFRDFTVAQKNIERGIIIAATGVALFGLKQFLFPEFLDPGFHALGKMKIYSTLGNPNLSALMLLAALPLTAYRFVCERGMRRMLHGGLCLLLLSGIVVMQSRHALLAVGVMCLVALAWLGPRRQRWMVILGTAIVASLAGVLMQWVEPSSALTHAVKGRWFIWLTSFTMLSEHPVAGVGLGHFGVQHMAYQGKLFATEQFNVFFDNAGSIQDAHNEFLHWGATTGVMGLIGFGLLCFGALWKGWHSADVREHSPHLYIGLAGYVFAMFFTSVLSSAATALIFWLFLGAVLKRSAVPCMAWHLQPRTRYVMAMVMAVLLLIGVGWAVRETRAGYDEARGDIAMAEHDLWRADKHYQNALSWRPESGALLKKYATTFFLAERYSDALQQINAAKRYSSNVGIHILEGETLARMGNLDAAIVVYQRIIAAFPGMITPRFILGQIYQLQGKQDLARSQFTKVLEIKPSPFNLNLTKGKVDLQKQIVRYYLGRQS